MNMVYLFIFTIIQFLDKYNPFSGINIKHGLRIVRPKPTIMGM